jgi:hypothetical protein
MRITRRQTPQTIDPATLKPGATFYHAHVWAGDRRARITRYHVLAIGKRIKYAADGISSFTLSQSGAIVTNYDATPAGALATLRARLAAEAAEVAAEIAIIDATTPTEPAPEPIKIHSSEKPSPSNLAALGVTMPAPATVTDRMRRYMIEGKDGAITYADSADAAEKIAAAWRRGGYAAKVVPPGLPPLAVTVISADGIEAGTLDGNTIHVAPANSDQEPDDTTGKR